MKNPLFRIWDTQLFDINKSDAFRGVIGHTDIKKILNNAIHSKKPVHILLVGPPGTAKTMFLLDINRLFKKSLFVVGSNTTKAGLVNRLFEVKPKFVLVDELEKMNYNDQISLLHLMETGIISETKVNKTRQMELSSWVFSTANTCEKIIKPLLSRFLVLEISAYTFEEFRDIAVSRLAKEKIDKSFASIIAEKVWNELGSRNARDVVKVGRLAGRIEDLSFIIKMMKKR